MKGILLFLIIITVSKGFASCPFELSRAVGMGGFGSPQELGQSVASVRYVPGLRQEIIQYIVNGGSVLDLGSKALGKALIQHAYITSDEKKNLNRLWDEGLQGIPGDPPHWFGDGSGGDGGNGNGGANDPYLAKTVSNELASNHKLMKCATTVSMLLLASSLVTTIGALDTKWKQYGGRKVSLWTDGSLFQGEIWRNANSDPEFWHNLRWNFLIMSVLGTTNCLQKLNLIKALDWKKAWVFNALTALVTSVVSQALGEKRLSTRQTALDTGFIGIISHFKTKAVIGVIQNYGLSPLAQLGLQGASELFGGYLYPWTRDAVKYLWPFDLIYVNNVHFAEKDQATDDDSLATAKSRGAK